MANFTLTYMTPQDGNVPTNYKIKSNIPAYSADDEEKNLGRWVNRQRSLFQAGKLKKTGYGQYLFKVANGML